MLVLGIETSCDETAVAVVRDDRTVLADLVLSQLGEHRKFGGVVPEIAARAHLEHLDGLIARALDEARVGFKHLDAVAATAGPGLIGGVIVGVTAAKAIALATGAKFLAINHLEAHALSARLVEDVPFPFLLLLVSGGHCQLLAVEDVGRYTRYGGTVDDAAGEAFDKVAKLIGLSYPGGPAIERAARAGDARRHGLPRPMRGRPGCDFSFSGLKTAVRHLVAGLPAPPAEAERADIAASFQQAVVDVMVDRTRRAIERFRGAHGRSTLVVAGGVAANEALRGALAALAAREGFLFAAPPLRLCTDNGAMVAWAGIERLRRGLVEGLDFAPRPRWPLDASARA